MIAAKIPIWAVIMFVTLNTFTAAGKHSIFIQIPAYKCASVSKVIAVFFCTEKTVYAIFRTQYEILCYPYALWICLVVTNNLIRYVLFHNHFTSNFSLYTLFDNWYNFIHNKYEYLLMKSGCYWELTWFILSI